LKKADKSPKSKKTQKKRKVHTALREVPRTKTGEPKFPLILSGGELTILSLGEVIPRAPFVNEKHIWPVGYRSIRVFASMTSPSTRVKYHCEIINVDDKPVFRVTPEDEPENAISSSSPSGAWREVLKRITDMKESPSSSPPSSPPLSSSPSSPLPHSPESASQIQFPECGPSKNSARVRGTLQFGLAHAVVVQLIRELPDIDKCMHIATSFASEKKKRKKSSSSDLDIAEDSNKDEPLPKYQKVSHIDETSEEVFEVREEIDVDVLEAAIATLHSLKHCRVY
jgi:hypothetical protein